MGVGACVSVHACLRACLIPTHTPAQAPEALEARMRAALQRNTEVSLRLARAATHGRTHQLAASAQGGAVAHAGVRASGDSVGIIQDLTTELFLN